MQQDDIAKLEQLSLDLNSIAAKAGYNTPPGEHLRKAVGEIGKAIKGLKESYSPPSS